LAAFLGVGLLAALLLASQLQPDPRGWGTHEQLGLPPCSFLAVVGKRCPACGMTTSWAFVTHGRLADALRAHASGTLLAAAAMATSAVALGVAVRGRRLAWQPGETVIVGLVGCMVGLVLIEWTFRLLTE
jgi:uncharacterized protein DUF2752